MTDVKLKRVYEDYDISDEYRILVDRLWPRGVKKEFLHYDLWAKNIAPSTDLRKFYHEYPDNHWNLFVSKYEEELTNSIYTREFVEKIKNYPTVTLLYASKDLVHNHAIILKKYLDKELKKANEK